MEAYSKDRFQFVDRLKGLAIILVVMGHVYFFSMHNQQGLWFDVISSFHMPLFMFLSGYVCISSFSPFPDWRFSKWIKKILRLLLPMCWFGLLFTLSLNWPTSVSVLGDKVHNFLMCPVKMGYWYLMTLSVFYIIIQCFRLNRSNSPYGDILLGVVIGVGLGVGWKCFVQDEDLFCLQNCAYFWPMFFLGMMVRKYNLFSFLFRSNWLFTVSLVGYLVLFNVDIPIIYANSFSRHYFIPFFAIVVLLMVFLPRENNKTKLEDMLAFIGKHTLDVYVIHYFLLRLFELKEIGCWMYSTGNQGLSLLLVTSVALLITFVSIYLGLLLRKSDFIRKVVFGEFNITLCSKK